MPYFMYVKCMLLNLCFRALGRLPDWWYLPCRKLLLDEAHCSMTVAHFGAKKIYKLLLARVWWPHMHCSCY